MMSKAIRIHAHGGPDVMQWEDVPTPEPGPAEALVHHTAVGLNYIDVYFRNGLYKIPVMPATLGMEAAGVVTAIGADVTAVKVGDRVAYATGPIGAYATDRVITADRLVRIPDGIADNTAAAMMLQGMTAQYLLRTTHRVVSTEAKAEMAREHGAAHTIIGHETLAADVKRITGGTMVPVVYDSVGKDTFSASLDSLAPLGLMVSFGNASGPVPPFDLGVLSAKGSLYLTRPTLATYTAKPADLAASAADLFDVVKSGAVKIRVNQTFPLKDAAAAHTALEARKTTGSTVLIP
jgi:NADPH2:quinone reductase